MAPPPKQASDHGSASASARSNNNNNSLGGATGAVPKQQHQVNGAPAGGTATATNRSARSRRQQEHLGEPDLDFVEPLQRETLKTLNVSYPRCHGASRRRARKSLLSVYKYTLHSSRPAIVGHWFSSEN